MKTILSIALIIVILYAIKVPGVVATVNQNIQVAITIWNYTIDVIINLRDRHPFIFISLFFILLATLMPSDHWRNK